MSEELLSKYSFRARKKLKSENSEEHAIQKSDSSKPLPSRKNNLVINDKNNSVIDDSKIKTEVVEINSSLSKTKRNKKQTTVKIEYEDSNYSNAASLEDFKIKVKEEGNLSKFEPLNWNIILDNIRKMRKGIHAPVDDMGCDQCFDHNANPVVIRYHVLVSLMLSSQTKDQVTHAAMQRLKDHGLTVDNILATDDNLLGKLIYPVSFWKTKVKSIKAATNILKNEYNSDIPNTVEKLCKLPGVGPKMAHLCMNVGWGIVTGIGVDTHVHRISNRLGWVRDTKTPEKTRKELEEWLPQELWSEVNHLLVGFGQTICRPLRPQCATCLNLDLCPFGGQVITEGKFKPKMKNSKK